MKLLQHIRKVLGVLALGIICFPLAAQQPVTVTGIVVDAEGQPLAGAYVISYKDATKTQRTDNAMADIDGRYTIKALPTDILEFSFIGYEKKDETVGVRGKIDVVLAPDSAQKLDEAVVIGYGSVRRQDLTGSVSNVRMADLNTSSTTNVDAALQGRIAGADVMTTTGEPGQTTTIRIRGTRSITASNEPLIVVDGVMDAVHDLNDINPSDIQDITVLKDASSTAIYGSRGSNGVILITTKSAKESSSPKPWITFKATSGVSTLARHLDLMNAYEFSQFRNEVRMHEKNDYDMPGADLTVSDPFAYGKGTDWMKEITRVAPYQDYYLSASGSKGGTKYFFSVNFNDDQGIIKRSGAQRTTTRVNISQEIFKWLILNYKMNYSFRNEDKLLATIGGTSAGYAAIYLAPQIKPHDTINPFYDGGQVINTPVAHIENDIYDITRHSTTQSVNIEAKIHKNFKMNGQFTYYFYERDSYQYYPSTLPSKQEGEGGEAYRAHESNRSFNFEVSGTFKKDWGKTHHMDAVGVFNAYKFDKNVFSLRGYGYIIDENLWNNMGAVKDKNTYSASTSYELVTKMSAIARVNYNYKNRYYITLNGRCDGSSNFAANNKWGFFPSVALKWNIYKEKWMKSAKKVDELALRLSVGQTGNDAISPYNSLAAMSSSTSGYLFEDQQPVSYYPSRIANPNLTWETTTTYNAALKGSFFNSRLSLELEGYHSTTKDLLLAVKTGQVTGYGSRFANLGRTSNTGVELTVESQNIRKKNFNWGTTFTISHNRQMVLDIGGEEYVSTYTSPAVGGNSYMICGYKKGYPLNALWGFKYAGVWHNQEEVERNKVSKAMAGLTADQSLGTPRYYDINHDGMLNMDDLCYLGNTDPIVYGGLGNNFRYKNFKLNVYFTYSLGGKIYNFSEFYMSGGSYTNQYRYMVNAWSQDRNPDSDLPRAGFYGIAAPSDFMVHDASFLRLQDVSFSYTIPFKDKNGKKKFLRDITLTVSGNNLFLLTEYNGFDPDVSSQGTSSTVRRLDLGAYPKPRRFLFTLQVRY